MVPVLHVIGVLCQENFHLTGPQMCYITTANTNVQWQIPEAAAEQNMDLEPHWLVAAAVPEKRNLRPAAPQAGC